jgi:hypothetical protein
MKKLYSCAVFLAIITASPAFANGLSLQNLFDGGTLTIYDKVFYGWSYTLYNYTTEPDFSLIDVIPLADDPLNPGIRYVANNQLSASVDGIPNVSNGEGYLELDFSFFVSTVSEKPLIKDNSLEITDYSYTFNNGSGFISLSENVYEDARSNFITYKYVYWDQGCISNPGSCTLSDQKEFAYQSSLWVNNYLVVSAYYDGQNGGSALVSLDSFDQRFSQVPEPTTMLLLGTGLVGVAGAVRRRKKDKT